MPRSESKRIYDRKRRRDNPEIKREYRERLRIEALIALGGKCECCDEDNTAFLAIDHKNKDGAAQRRNSRSRTIGETWYRRIRDGEVEDVRVLCHNCNFADGVYGQCPHELERAIAC